MEHTSTSAASPPRPPDDPATAPAADPAPVKGNAVHPGDKVFRSLSRGSGITLLVIMAAIAAFLTYRASIAISQDSVNFLTAFK